MKEYKIEELVAQCDVEIPTPQDILDWNTLEDSEGEPKMTTRQRSKLISELIQDSCTTSQASVNLSLAMVAETQAQHMVVILTLIADLVESLPDSIREKASVNLTELMDVQGQELAESSSEYVKLREELTRQEYRNEG